MFEGTCVYEIDRLGTTENCGLPIADDADPDEFLCPWHDGAVDRGDITWSDYQLLRRHYLAEI
ncbi:hypothetical protein [Nocardiopsis nanhaiensis]